MIVVVMMVKFDGDLMVSRWFNDGFMMVQRCLSNG